jgi:hypothetical protein
MWIRASFCELLDGGPCINPPYRTASTNDLSGQEKAVSKATNMRKKQQKQQRRKLLYPPEWQMMIHYSLRATGPPFSLCWEGKVR